jgi:uncharacterized repeat protein (TIGR03803 family)
MLDVGAASTGTVTVAVPGATAPGTYYLLACADDTKQVAESNENNNCTASSGTVVVSNEKVLFNFTGGTDGSEPTGTLVQDAAGNLYGTTLNGGAQGLGVVFRLAASGKEKVLHSFNGGADGVNPLAGPILDTMGNLYGTTSVGGSQNLGIAYKLDSSGNETVLHTFGVGADGANVPAGLIEDEAGNLYGVTYYGGAYGVGTVFELASSGSESVLYDFTGQTDGGDPDTSLVQDTAGNLYGATRDGCGVVFELTPTREDFVLLDLGDSLDNPGGCDLRGDLVRDAAANLFGTTYYGGASGYGVVFKLDPSGNETVLHSFSGGMGGANPQSGLVQDAAGNFYGTTYNGGPYGLGVVFKLDSSGNESVLHYFAGGADGANPYGGLLLDAAGDLYGTTRFGGTSGHGTVFKIPAPAKEFN